MPKPLQKVCLLSIIVCALVFLQTGCKKHDVYPGQTLPKIITVNPTSAKGGDTVQIKGSDLSAVTDVKFGTTDAKMLSTHSDTLISAIVPDSLPVGDTYVQVYIGDGQAYAAASFKVLETPKVPMISAVNPVTAFPGDNITITGINFMNVSSVTFDSSVANFTIGDSTKLTVTIPANVKNANEIITVSAPTGFDTVSFTVNFAPVVSSFTPDNGVEGDLITVAGKRFTGATSVKLGDLDTKFIVVNDTTITFPIPANAVSGNVTVVTPKGTGVSATPLTVLMAGLAFPIYDDAVTSNWTNSGYIGGGWGGTADYANTSPVESGSNSVKIDYVGGYGSPMQLGGASVDLTPYTTFKISLYGGPGSNGLKVNLGINQQDAYTITIVEGKWTDYQIPISALTTSSTLTDIWLKEYNGTGGFTVYVDNMGLN